MSAYVGFNNQKPPFNDVRAALNMLIDRQAIIKAVLQGRGVPARGSIRPAFRAGRQTRWISYDPKKPWRCWKKPVTRGSGR